MAGRVLALVLGWLVLVSAPGLAHAQVSAMAAAASKTLDHAQGELRAVWKASHQPDIDDQGLSKLQAALPPVQAEIHNAVDPLRPQRDAADARLTTLGPPPQAGAPPEAPAIAQDRKAQTALRTSLDAQIKRGDLLLVEAEQLGEKLASMRVDAFSRKVGARSASVLSPDFWSEPVAKFPHDLQRWSDLLRAEAQAATKAVSPRSIGVFVLSVLVALFLALPLRVLAERHVLQLAIVRKASERLRRAELAVFGVLIRAILPTLGAAAVVFALASTNLLSREMADIGWAAVRAIGFASVAGALGRAVLGAHRPQYRLLPLGDAAAEVLSIYPVLLGGVSALGQLVLEAIRATGVSLAASMAAQAVLTAVDLVVIALALWALGRARMIEAQVREEGGLAEPGRGVWTLALVAGWLALAVGVAALCTGYVAFAFFLVREIIWIVMVVGLLYVLVSLTDAFFAELAPGEGVVGRFVAQTLGLESRTLDQLSVLLGGLTRVVLWLIAWAAILIPFGAGAEDAVSRLQAGATSFRMGGVTVAPAAIAGAIGLFLLGVFVTRLFRRWLETQYLPHTRLDAGLSATVATGVSYIGGLLALLMASSYLGLKLTQVTLIASALTVGVGFGLQSVIQNFVAGLILLAERPVRVGDWIAVGGQEGDVQRINVRATEIKLFDGSVLVLPNQEMVTKPVRNVTWGAPFGQVQIVFTVGYEADFDTVNTIVLEAMKQTRGVLKEPAPHVAITEFKDGGAVFRGVASVATPRAVYRAKSEVLFELARRMRAAGIRLGVDTSQAVTVRLEPAAAAEEPEKGPQKGRKATSA